VEQLRVREEERRSRSDWVRIMMMAEDGCVERIAAFEGCMDFAVEEDTVLEEGKEIADTKKEPEAGGCGRKVEVEGYVAKGEERIAAASTAEMLDRRDRDEGSMRVVAGYAMTEVVVEEGYAVMAEDCSRTMKAGEEECAAKTAAEAEGCTETKAEAGCIEIQD
jgi:uncharacterized membrane-anchored protein